MLTLESIRLRAQRSGLRIGLGVGSTGRPAGEDGGRDLGFADVLLYNDARQLAEDLLNGGSMRRCAATSIPIGPWRP